MGNKEKKKHRYRSKERKSKRSKKERADNSPSRDSRSQSPVERKHLHKKSSHRRKNRSDSESSDRSAGRSKSHRSRSYNKRKKRSDSSGSGSSDRSAERSKSHRSRSHNKRKKRSDSSESSLSDQSIERKLADKDRKKREEFLKEKEERRLQKELIKSLETPEEKRARRLAKKEAKERRRKEKMGWDKDYMGYTNVDNPFGDEHLLDAFVWEKKMGKDGRKDFTRTDMQKMANSKMGENRRELEKVKQRRLEREKELEERENERERLQREKEAEYFREWEKQEDSFHLSQAKLRSQIRIQDGRAKPIDLLAKYISAEDDELAIEMHEPYTYLHGLTIVDIEDLLEDIKVYLELEEGKNTDYWRDIVTVTEDELNKLRKMDTNSREYIGDRREGIHQAVTSEVNSVFKGKTTSQLRLLENQIKEKLKGGEGIDIGYWESLLQQLKAHMARTRLRERHQDVLRQKLHKLKQEQGIETGPLFPVVEMSRTEERQTDSGTAATSETSREMIQSESADTLQEQHIEEESEVLITEEDLEKDAIDEYIAGNYSPRLFQPAELDIDAIVYDTVDDFQKLELARTQVLTIGKVKLDAETEFEKAAREGMNDDEAQFSVELALDKQAFLWSDKYRPRKPRFFNRVHTGFEWNKYNQTHYDIDNPPPKIVQGYKFNIFYPDLIDKTDTPEYTVTPSDDNKDFAVLRFHSGPPYEDIAFKIVNREWEYSYKRGFRCQFQNNIFQLWFHFKRYRYRR